MSIGEHLTSGWQGRQVTPRRVALFLVGVAVLVAIVLFNQDIVNLFKWLRGGAAGEAGPWGDNLNKQWTQELSSNFGRSNAKLIDVTLPAGNLNAGRRYLYLIGGIETKQIDGEDRLRLINTVERIELDKGTGEIIGANWEYLSGSAPATCKVGATVGTGNWSYMCSGHAEFGVLQSDDLRYLYVISGDIHIPNPDDPAFKGTKTPLLFSTVERLDLTNEINGWQPVALVTGVNFYPEVVKFNNRFHIIGGIYGNPFSKGHTWMIDVGGGINPYEIKDPLLPADDAINKWGVYGSLPVIGNMPVALPNGGIGANIIAGGGTVDPGGLTISGLDVGGQQTGMADDQVHIQQVVPPNQNLADTLTRGLISGKFVTSVSEHYIVNPAISPLVAERTTELGKKSVPITTAGNDYLGTLYDTWTVGKVMRIEHLRFAIDYFYISDTLGTYQIYPAPQGRYGHKAFVQNDQLWVVGGAAWSSPIERIYLFNDIVYPLNIFTFWVIDDEIDPITRPDSTHAGFIIFDNSITPLHDYQYAGNITYQWNGNSYIWVGTNDQYNLNDQPLSPKYALKKDIQSKGRAFFAFAQLKPGPDADMVEPLITGGLENNSTLDTSGWSGIPGVRHSGGSSSATWGISILTTGRVEKLTKEDLGWQPRTATDDTLGATYGSAAFSAGALAAVFGGQTEFLVDPEQPFTNDHVPAYERAVNTKTVGYADSAGETGEGGWYPFTTPNTIYSGAYPAVLDVRTPISVQGGEKIYIYKATGSNVSGGDDLPNTIRGVESLGMFQYGAHGTVDFSKSFFTITPTRPDSADNKGGYYHWPSGDITPQVYADRHDYALVTLNLVDYYGDAALVDVGVGATLYTNRSPKPAVHKEALDDWIRINGTPLATSGGLPSPAWDAQFVLVDRGGAGAGEDGNSQTSLGQAAFFVSSYYNTFDTEGVYPAPNLLFLSMYLVDTNTGTGLADGALGTPLDQTRLIFTHHGVPGMRSILTATSPVKADDIDKSNVIGTLIDRYDDIVVGIETNIESNRNQDTNPDTGEKIINDHITTINNVSNAQGIVRFEVRSPLVGRADITGYYIPPIKAPDEPSAGQIIGYKKTSILFDNNGRISLFPESARQGDSIANPAPMVATGDLVLWEDTPPDITTVKFIPPNAVSFQYENGNDWSTDINHLMLYADESVTNFKLVASGQVNTTLYLGITEGGGSFFTQGYPTNITVTTDAFGEAGFSYISGLTPGILKIEIKLGSVGGNKIGDLWLPIAQSDSHIQVRVSAVPESLGVGESALIKAEVFNIHGNHVFDDNLVINFSKDDGAKGDFIGSINPSAPDGEATITYRRVGAEAGEVHIFASVTYSSGTINETASERVAIQKIADAVTPANQTITHDVNGMILAMIDVSIPRMTLTFGGAGVSIGIDAPIGVWTFMASTPISGNDPKVETTSFIVKPAGSVGPILTGLDPDTGIRGHTGGYDIGITGDNTNFVYSGPAAGLSKITFTSMNEGGSVDLPIVTSPAIPNGWEHLTVHWDIPADAKLGWWDVKVVTGSEIAEMPINNGKDFLVTTPDGYYLDIAADPPGPLIRNGSDTSEIKATAGHVDPSTDTGVVPEVNKATTFSVNGGGSLGTTETTTNASGEATSLYTTDSGATTAVADIQASVVIDAAKTLIGSVQITRNGLGGDEVDLTRSTISAVTPVPTSTDGTDYSTVTVTLRNNANTPLNGKTVTLSTSRGYAVDFIKVSNSKPTDADGKAVFEVWSSTLGATTIKATIGVAELSTDVEFVTPGSVSQRFFALTVPFQARDYETKDKVWVIIKHNGAEKNIDEEYRKNSRNATNPDLLADLQGIKFYLYTGTSDSYTVWVKGKNHLAASKTTVKASDADGTGTININFDSLKIGDIATAGAAEIRPGYHDNTIGKMSGLTSTEDLGLLYSNWFKTFDLGDFTQDGIINSIDMLYLFLNWGAGAALP